MKEKAATDRARDAIKLACPHAKIYKHNDRATKGMPDTSVTWNDRTSWLEFKMLHGNEDVHGELHGLQLVECVRLEHACHRAWIVAYRKATKAQGECLTIYRPTALLNNQQPIARMVSTFDNLLANLRAEGVARFEGFHHAAVVQLILQTHF